MNVCLPLIPASVKKHSFYKSLCPATRWQNLLFRPWFGVFQAKLLKDIRLRRSVFFTDIGRSAGSVDCGGEYLDGLRLHDCVHTGAPLDALPVEVRYYMFVWIKDVSHEAPDVTPCRTSPPMPVFRTHLERNAWCKTMSHLTAAGCTGSGVRVRHILVLCI